MTYQDKLKDPRWQKKRLEILARDKWECRKCGDKKTTLHVHHLEYNNNPWETDSKDLVTLCEHCHQHIEGIKELKCAFKDMKILKFNKWQSENRIMFVSNGQYLTMEIYNKDNQHITGFNLPKDLILSIKRMCNNAIRLIDKNNE